MSDLDLATDAFLLALRRRYLGAAAVVAPGLAQELQALISLWPEAGDVPAPAPRRLPACDHLDGALAAGRQGTEAAIADALASLTDSLCWTYSYPARPTAPDLSSRVAFCQIAGPGGLRRSDQLRLGLTLIAPETRYPAHLHPAIETYLVIAGTGLWWLGSADPTLQPPGALIFHPSGVPHAMQTAGEPLLAVYSWRGDVVSPSVYLDA
jgi:quercetin dioxygenase-like cupin family protein